MEVNPTVLEIVILLLISIAIYVWVKQGKRIRRWCKARRKRRRGPQQPRPREPGDCPDCSKWGSWLPRRPQRDVAPWSEIKSPRGRPKTVDTKGHACMSWQCNYFGITDPDIHALVGNGRRGKDKEIQYFRCQACGKRQTSRLGTPMYYIKTALGQVAMVMTAMSEGVSIAAATRIFGHHPTTIARWVARGGQHSARLHERTCFRALTPGHVQFDELVTTVKHGLKRVWVWTGMDAESKLIFSLHIGGRAIADACQLIHQVWQRLAPGCWPVFTSDGLNQYFHGLTAHFGSWEKPPGARKFHWIPDPRLLYAQLRKIRRGRRVVAIDHLVRLGTFPLILIMLCALGFSGVVQTAFIERANLTLRALVAPLARRTWSIAHDIPHLGRHLQWGLAYYNFVRPHQSLRIRVRGPSRGRHRTPAMAAGLTRKPWSVADILLMPIPEACWLAPFPAA